MAESSEPIDILLVDDKPENLLALEELLRRPDRALHRATSGNEALRLLLKREFAMVLLDVEMPDMDGFETAQLMRTSERTKLVPIIFITAGDRSEERTFRGYEAGAVDFLYKPINAHALSSKVEVFGDLYLKRRELARANALLERREVTLREKIADLEDVNRTLSHDLRAPLRSIRAFSQILVETHLDRLDDDGKDALERIVKASGRLDAMIDDLYNLLRLSADDADATEVDVGRVLADVVENLRTDLERAGASVVHDGLPRVRGNRRLVAQVLQNLIGNAVKFRSEAPPQVSVRAERRGGHFIFSVRDNGVGIPPADRERVFNLFERLGSSSGSGVGLALCKRAVEKLGGQIWVADAADPGTTFCFTVPVPASA
ncbi:MAG: response regulator [Deltaproteobacteria bacterium]|nr:response regulator [Deltaproteobacteria bacterium]MCW5803636.1 response regulator [Deltaproteobacteria bacterium]